MAHEYVFRGERKPYVPDPEEQRARDQAKREADRLVDRTPPENDLSADAEVERRIGDYQVGGLDAFGASSARPSWEPGQVSKDEHESQEALRAVQDVQNKPGP